MLKFESDQFNKMLNFRLKLSFRLQYDRDYVYYISTVNSDGTYFEIHAFNVMHIDNIKKLFFYGKVNVTHKTQTSNIIENYDITMPIFSSKFLLNN